MCTKWIAEELRACRLPDQRLQRRLTMLVDQLHDHLGASIPTACQDWAATKAAYRFFDNDRVTEAAILQGHFEATSARYLASHGPILVLQDTTEFTYQRDAESLGFTTKVPAGGAKRPQMRTVRGLLMHGSLAVTVGGLPLGLAAVKFWTRKKYKGTNELKRHVNPTRIPIEEKESFRWIQSLRESTERLGNPSRLVHVGDRESDIYELFCAAQETGSHFLVRTCVDRLAEDGSTKVSTEMEEVRVKGLHRVEVRDGKGSPSEAVLDLRYKRLRVQPPIGKQKRYPPLTLTVLHATERDEPQGRTRIEWKLLTDLPVSSRAEAIEKLHWYAQRWKIETYHKVLKSGCKAEDLRLETAERLTNAIAVYCILAWRILWMTMLNRADHDLPASHVFTELEQRILDRLQPQPAPPRGRRPLKTYIQKLARLGGFLARKGDGPPGNMVIWRGLSRLTQIEIGVLLAGGDVGN